MMRFKDPRAQAKADKIIALLQSDCVDAGTIEKFIEWFFSNQIAWGIFKDLANKARAQKRKFGAKAIAEICRWQIEIEKYNNEFKINNNYVAYMARLYNANVKQEYFETRDVRGLKEAA